MGKYLFRKRKSHDVLESPHVQQLFSIPHEIREVCLNVFSAHQLQMQITQCIIATSYYTLPFCMSVFFFCLLGLFGLLCIKVRSTSIEYTVNSAKCSAQVLNYNSIN